MHNSWAQTEIGHALSLNVFSLPQFNFEVRGNARKFSHYEEILSLRSRSTYHARAVWYGPSRAGWIIEFDGRGCASRISALEVEMREH